MVVDAHRALSGTIDASRVEWRGTPASGPGVLSLRRGWVSSAGHLLAELIGEGGRVFGAQWFEDLRLADEVEAALARASDGAPAAWGRLALAGGSLILQAGGADDVLDVLASLAAKGELLVHRPTRRAVVRLREAGAVRYAKVVPIKRLEGAVRAGDRARALAGGAFETPELVRVERGRRGGVMVWSGLSGTGLHEAPTAAAFVEGCGLAGRALRALHDGPAEGEVDAEAPERELARWCERTAWLAPEIAARARSALEELRPSLRERGAERVLLHRDFYEKQVLIAGGERVGLLDFDTLGPGEPGVDLGNFAAHLDLREGQGRLTRGEAARAWESFVRAYGLTGESLERSAVHARAARVRLACVYAARAGQAGLVERLLDRGSSSVVDCSGALR